MLWLAFILLYKTSKTDVRFRLLRSCVLAMQRSHREDMVIELIESCDVQTVGWELTFWVLLGVMIWMIMKPRSTIISIKMICIEGWLKPSSFHWKEKLFLYLIIYLYVLYSITVCSFCPVCFPKSMLFQKYVCSFKPIVWMQTFALGFMVHVLLRFVVVSHVLRFVWTFLVWLYFCWVTVSIPMDIHFWKCCTQPQIGGTPMVSSPRSLILTKMDSCRHSPFPPLGCHWQTTTVAWSNTHLNTNHFSSCDPWTYTHLLI